MPKSESKSTPKVRGGPELACKGWPQEAALRLLMNSLDEEVAGESLNVQDRESYELIVRTLRELESDRTLLVHPGMPLDIVRTHEHAPCVLIRNSTGCHNEAGIRAYAEVSTASWLSIGSQQIVLPMFEAFCEAGEQHFNSEQGGAPMSNLAGKLIVSGGLGRISGAQPVAATMTGAAFLGIDVDPEQIKHRLKRGECDFMVNSLDEALRILKNSLRKRENISVGLAGNCAEVIPELADRGVLPDILTDLTPAQDPRAYVPSGMALTDARELRARDPEQYEERARASIARHAEAMLRLQKMGSITFDFGEMRGIASQQAGNAAGVIPSFVEYLHPLLAAQRRPLRCIALSGARADIAAADELLLELFPQDHHLRRWLDSARRRIRFTGLPARIAWLDPPQQREFALAINRLVAQAKIKAPVVLGLERLDWNLLATGGRTKSATAIDTPLETLLDAASGASVISTFNDAGSLCHSALAIVADGSDAAADRIERLLGNA